MGISKAPKNLFIISSRSQSVLTSSLEKTVGIEKPQTDSHLTTYSTNNVKSISHESPTNIKGEIDTEPRTKIKRKSNLNHYNDEILHESKNESQFINERFLEEPELGNQN